MADYHEHKLEQEIAEHLVAAGWLYSVNDSGYDRERALFAEHVIGWLADTQADERGTTRSPTTSSSTLPAGRR